MPDTAVMDAPASPSSTPSSTPAPTTSSTSGGNSNDVTNFINSDFDAAPSSDTTPTTPSPIEKPVETEATPAQVPPVAAETAPVPPEELTPDELPKEFEDLPEGITVAKNKAGHKTYSIPEEQFGDIHTAYAMSRAAEEILGEPLTPETLTELQQARLTNARLETDLISTDGNSLDRMLTYMSDLGRAANQNGLIRHDPIAALAERLPDYLERQNGQAYTIQANKYARKILDQTYRIAANQGNEDLFRAAQWMDKAIFEKYSKPGDIPKHDPIAERQAQLDAREQAWNQQNAQAGTQRWNADVSGLNNGIQAETKAHMDSLLVDVKKYYEDLKAPQAVDGMKQQLQTVLNESIAKDEAWKNTRNTLLARAQQAVDPAVRKEIMDQVRARYAHKFKIVLDPRRNAKVREIINAGAVQAKASADAAHTRNAAASERREPAGTGATPPRSVMPPVPEKAGRLNHQDLADEIRGSF